MTTDGNGYHPLAGRAYLITGAGHGIGRAAARKLLSLGATVGVNDLRDNFVAEAESALADTGGRFVGIAADVSTREGIRGAVERLAGTAGRLDGLVLNAGAMVPGGISELSAADWDTLVAVNLTGAFLVARCALPHLLQLNCDVITFECASSDGRDLPLFAKHKTDKKIGIGVVNHCNTIVEPAEHVANLIRKALDYIPPERLVITTDCGFGREGLSRRIAYYKCVALVEGTNIVRRELGLPEARIRAADPRLYFATAGS